MAILIQLTGWIWLRLSHNHLAKMWPMSLAWRELLALAGKSFWVYLYCLSAGIYLAISRLLINAGFGPDQVPVYQYNNRLCELALFVIISASLASMPKITQWLASPDSSFRERALREAQRLNTFQTFIGCSAAVGYLVINELFIRYWLGKNLHAPVWWQAAFAANLAVTAAGYVGFDLAARCCENGIRVGGMGVALSALLNLGLSLLAMKFHKITGIAFAMVISQSLLTLGLGYYSCRQTGISWWQLTFKNWLLALAVVALGTVVRFYIPLTSLSTAGINAAILLIVMLLLAGALGIKPGELRAEVQIVRDIFQKKRETAQVSRKKV
jgi:O-antigen/teichoic acid export membrane protein